MTRFYITHAFLKWRAMHAKRVTNAEIAADRAKYHAGLARHDSRFTREQQLGKTHALDPRRDNTTGRICPLIPEDDK